MTIARRAVVVMGVSAAGKSTVASALADRLGVAWVDADRLHSPASLSKMSAGIALDDADRLPWLTAVGVALADQGASGGVVLACSALKRRYRDLLRVACPSVAFIHLTGSRELLAARMAMRSDHFMPTTLLDSQLETLEPLGPDEHGVEIDVTPPPAHVADSAAAWLARADSVTSTAQR